MHMDAHLDLKAKLFDDSDYDFTTFAAEIQIEIFQTMMRSTDTFILEALLKGHRRWRISTALAVAERFGSLEICLR